jgi:hypothetical protein
VQSGVKRGWGDGGVALAVPRLPRELKRASWTSVTNSSSTTLAGGTDLPGVIDFINEGLYDVEVEIWCEYVYNALTSCCCQVDLVDAANTSIEKGIYTTSGAFWIGQILVRERITAAGSYSRHGRLWTSVGTGQSSVGVAGTTNFIRAYEIKTKT